MAKAKKGLPDPAKGGRARANVLSKEERREIAIRAAKARWGKAVEDLDDEDESNEMHGPEEQASEPGPETDKLPHSLLTGTIQFGNISIECHVLSDHRRVLTQREMVRVISGGRESGNLQRYLSRNPLTAENFDMGPVIRFKNPGSRLISHGYEAPQLIEVCDRYLQAREENAIKGRQLALAKQAEIVLRACAKVGIIALVDEATGFQKIRAQNALRLKLQAFIAEDLQEWARMFPNEFWLELARLEGIRYSPRSRPIRWGKYIMMFVYDAVDPDIGKWLRENNPDPHFKKNHHQWLKKFGRESVHDQITKVVTVMKLCKDMNDFRAKFAHVFKNAPLQMTFNDLDLDN
ncbi:P63C domain-containing protein [Limnoglobus roseus]|uniref:Bacteriophage Mx8 p63 C-terminal domain-containing protein n=1 Tax=Limnoglobus roseus TaxID=2598579 RepID=A0A5C1AFF4_9BACT|nr:P63C domain-containing protein [Limnoglobus roseus]QEL16462.1 hypothetical protein PX52LOC_03416 [Limnoglobus roseus]